MSREHVLETVVSTLQKAGWEQSLLPTSCFDVLGRGEEHAALFKVQGNVDSMTKERSEEMKRAAQYLSASPLIIGERNSRGELEKQVVYERYGIPTIKPETLETYLDMQRSVFVVNKKGGYYVPIDGDRMEEQRLEQGYSINALAKDVGVSSRTIRKYRDNGMATLETVQRLEQVLGDVTASTNIFETEIRVSHQTISRQDRVVQHLVRIGLDATGFEKAPFDIAARDDTDSFIAKRDAERMDDPVMELLVAIKRLMQSNPVLISDDPSPDSRVSTISEDRLRRIKSKKELKEEIVE